MIVAPIILCGGFGKRLFPFSSEQFPKQFMPFFKDGESFFQKTIRRVRRVFKTERIVVVANKIHEKLVIKQLSDIAETNVFILFECYSCNTFLSIIVAEMLLSDKCDVLPVFPTDHFILDEIAFQEDILSATDISLVKEKHILFGIKPKKFDNNYGYIQIDEIRNHDSIENNVFMIKNFTEKPSKRIIAKKMHSDCYFWNSGIFIFNRKRLKEDIYSFRDDMAKIVKDNIFIKQNSSVCVDVLVKNISILPDQPIDEAIIEGNRKLLCKKAKFSWQDVGSFSALSELMKKDYIHFSIPEYIKQYQLFVNDKQNKFYTT